jgi:mRNA interferase MazF
MNQTRKPSRGEIWLITLDPTKGRGQAGTRPCLVLSVDDLNHGPADLAVVLPITTAQRNVPSHIRIDPPMGGLRRTSYVKCEDLRSVCTTERFVTRWGRIEQAKMREVERVVRLLLGL